MIDLSLPDLFFAVHDEWTVMTDTVSRFVFAYLYGCAIDEETVWPADADLPKYLLITCFWLVYNLPIHQNQPMALQLKRKQATVWILHIFLLFSPFFFVVSQEPFGSHNSLDYCKTPPPPCFQTVRTQIQSDMSWTC